MPEGLLSCCESLHESVPGYFRKQDRRLEHKRRKKSKGPNAEFSRTVETALHNRHYMFVNILRTATTKSNKATARAPFKGPML
jgi:hypothetical protein